jgi:hypothetical protein
MLENLLETLCDKFYFRMPIVNRRLEEELEATAVPTQTINKNPQRYINKNRVCYRYLDNEVSCQQLFCCICPAI